MGKAVVRSSEKKRYIIIGAGPCGLGAGWRLTELGLDDFTIYERAPHPGGLAASYRDANGFIWDVGGHVLHSHYPYFDRMFKNVMHGDYLTHERESWVWIDNRFVPYPFQNNIHRLPPKIRDACLAGLEEVSSRGPRALHTFADWIVASFGKGIADHFLLPYNEKVWACPPDQMSYVWVGDRVAKVDIGRIEENIRLHRDDISWGPNATFQFPKNGGTGEIWNRVARRFTDHISYDKQVIRIDSQRRRVHFRDGSTDTYDVLLSTMPLDMLVSMVSDVVFPKSMPLSYSQVSVVGLGMKGSVPEYLQTKCWMYFPEANTPFFRATVFSNYSPNNAPNGTWSLMTETSSSVYRPLPKGDMATHVIDGAISTKLIERRSDIVDTWVFQTQHGYPIPTLHRDAYVHAVLPKLALVDIYARGRFGAWKYEVSNQDHTFMQGVEWVNRMIFGTPEVTLNHPEMVNAK